MFLKCIRCSTVATTPEESEYHFYKHLRLRKTGLVIKYQQPCKMCRADLYEERKVGKPKKCESPKPISP